MASPPIRVTPRVITPHRLVAQRAGAVREQADVHAVSKLVSRWNNGYAEALEFSGSHQVKLAGPNTAALALYPTSLGSCRTVSK